MTEAVYAGAMIEERQLLKSLRWYDGFVIALANPGFLIGALGGSIGVLGGWGAMTLWGVSMFMGVLQNWVYSEQAAMFPDKPGGISLYAHEGGAGTSRSSGPWRPSATGSPGRACSRASASSSGTSSRRSGTRPLSTAASGTSTRGP